MSLKDEIEKLIRTEQEKLEKRDQKTEEHYERQKQRFIHMRAIIEEISKSVEPKYMNASIDDSRARIEIGRKNSRDYFEEAISWGIQPNYEIQLPSWKDKGMYSEQPGFRVEERLTFQYPNYETSENTYTFKDEQATAEYLVKRIAEKVGHYRHLETLVERSRSRK